MFSLLRTAVLLSGVFLAIPALSAEHKNWVQGKQELLNVSELTSSLPAHIKSGIATKVLIDKHLNFEWCTHNFVAPLGVEDSPLLKEKRMIIAIGKIEYLGIVGDFLIRKLASDGYKLMFIELPEDVILSLIDGPQLLTGSF